jgi:hypothetical protein
MAPIFGHITVDIKGTSSLSARFLNLLWITCCKTLLPFLRTGSLDRSFFVIPHAHTGTLEDLACLGET